MPIELLVTTPEQRQQEHARRLELAASTTLAEIRLPTGGMVAVERTPAGYQMSGDLSLFGLDAMFDVLPLTEAVDEADAVRLADDKVRARWVRECCDGACRADTDAEAAALEG